MPDVKLYDVTDDWFLGLVIISSLVLIGFLAANAVYFGRLHSRPISAVNSESAQALSIINGLFIIFAIIILIIAVWQIFSKHNIIAKALGEYCRNDGYLASLARYQPVARQQCGAKYPNQPIGTVDKSQIPLSRQDIEFMGSMEELRKQGKVSYPSGYAPRPPEPIRPPSGRYNRLYDLLNEPANTGSWPYV